MGARQVPKGFLLAVALSATTMAFADGLTGSGSASLQSWLAADLNENGSPYWDNTSSDGDQRNVGYYLINAPTAPLAGAPGTLPFWGTTGGGADLSFYFVRPVSSSSSSTVDLKLEIAAQSNVNEFGWYDKAAPATLHPLFLGPDSPSVITNFSPNAQYGFYLKSLGEGTYYTQSSLNSDPSDKTHQHFVVFQESATLGAEIYWIGIEDLSRSALDGKEDCVGDYNDMIVRLSALSPSGSVPEPSTVVLVLAGAGFILGFLRRRGNKEMVATNRIID